MSKPVVRIVLAVLISLGVVLAVAANVPDRLGLNADSFFAGADEQSSVAGRVSLSARADTSSSTSSQFDKSMSPRSGHECGSYADAYADD